MAEKLYNYYERQSILPTFGNLKVPADLEDYIAARSRFFSDKLLLPLQMFRNADLLEFGPDSGENAMAFATWGASLTLAEPNERALGAIEAYFKRFQLDHRLRKIVSADVESFWDEMCFDVLDAEGFIYTVQPTELWLKVFHNLLRPGGYPIVSYYERYGALFELSLKAIHAAGKTLIGGNSEAVARALFQAKWDSIPHTRSFQSWVMDVIENPFVRLRYFLDAGALCEASAAQGFSLHSSWPAYRDPLAVYWHKKNLEPGDQLARDLGHVRRSRLSFVAGRKLYLSGDEGSVAAIEATIASLLADLDSCVDAPSEERLAAIGQKLSSLRHLVGATPVLADAPQDIGRFLATLESYERIFDRLRCRDFAGATALTSGDAPFISEWGMPTHFLVLRKQ